MDTLKVQLSKLEEKADHSDAYERRDTVIVSGDGVPEVTGGEICSNIVAM